MRVDVNHCQSVCSLSLDGTDSGSVADPNVLLPFMTQPMDGSDDLPEVVALQQICILLIGWDLGTFKTVLHIGIYW